MSPRPVRTSLFWAGHYAAIYCVRLDGESEPRWLVEVQPRRGAWRGTREFVVGPADLARDPFTYATLAGRVGFCKVRLTPATSLRCRWHARGCGSIRVVEQHLANASDRVEVKP